MWGCSWCEMLSTRFVRRPHFDQAYLWLYIGKLGYHSVYPRGDINKLPSLEVPELLSELKKPQIRNPTSDLVSFLTH